MIPHTTACQVVLRFSGQPGFPETLEAQRELAVTMAEVATDQDHANRIAAAWLHENHWAPTPCRLVALAQSTKAPPKVRDPCGRCGNTGFVSLPERVIHGDTYAGVEACGCRGGG